MKKQKGFTLIELLIVVSLIGILSGVLISVMDPNASRSRARDTQRISDLKKIQVALEMRFSDTISYPTSAQGLTLLQTQGYLNPIPLAPSPGPVYFYESPVGGVAGTYNLVAQLERSDNANGFCGNSGYSPCFGLQDP